MTFFPDVPCARRTYRTNLNIEECRQGLLMKNIYDQFEYKVSESLDWIDFFGVRINNIIPMGNFETRYVITWEIQDCLLFFRIWFVDSLNARMLGEKALDHFFKMKIDAVPVQYSDYVHFEK